MTRKYSPTEVPGAYETSFQGARINDFASRAWAGNASAKAWFRRMIDRLDITEREREAATLRFIDGRTCADAGAVMGVTASRVSKIQAKVLRALIRTMDESGFRPGAPVVSTDSIHLRLWLTPLPDWALVSLDSWEERGDAPWCKRAHQ